MDRKVKNETILSTIFSLLNQRIISWIAFHPPHATYYLMIHNQESESDEPDNIMSLRIDLNYIALDMIHKKKFRSYRAYLSKNEERIKPYFIETCRGNNILCLSLEPPEIAHNLVIVYSHTNGSDIGILIGSIWKVAKKIKCIVVMYDYSGYGLSSGKPSERNIYADIESVIEDLVKRKGRNPKSLILYGESIGSVPTIYMASHLSVGGVIIQSGIASGLRVLFGMNCSKKTLSFDPFPNIDRIDKIDCPVLIIHGLRDIQVDFSHGLALYKKCKHKYDPLFIRGGDHNNIRGFPVFAETVKDFVEKVKLFHKID